MSISEKDVKCFHKMDDRDGDEVPLDPNQVSMGISES